MGYFYLKKYNFFNIEPIEFPAVLRYLFHFVELNEPYKTPQAYNLDRIVVFLRRAQCGFKMTPKLAILTIKNTLFFIYFPEYFQLSSDIYSILYRYMNLTKPKGLGVHMDLLACLGGLTMSSK